MVADVVSEAVLDDDAGEASLLDEAAGALSRSVDADAPDSGVVSCTGINPRRVRVTGKVGDRGGGERPTCRRKVALTARSSKARRAEAVQLQRTAMR